MSDAGSNFIYDTFKRFCQSLNIEQAVSSSRHHQSNGQVEAYIIFKKHTIKKCTDAKLDIHIDLLQIRSTPLGPGLLCPAKLLFNCPLRDIMPIINRPPVNSNKGNEHYEALIKRQTKNENHETSGNYAFSLLGSIVVVQ